MRMTRMVWAALAPHVKGAVSPSDYMLFPEEALDLPEDVDAQEREWMLKLQRSGT